MARPISEQVIVVLGASTGIGLATAIEAAARGARVVLAARDEAALEDAVARIRAHGGDAIAVRTDATDFEQVQALARRAAEVYGRIDTWVNMAGVLNLASFRDQSVEDFRQVIEVNLMGQVHGAKAALPYLEQTGGALICVGSAYSDRGAPLWTSYSASKHAVRGLVEALRVELRHAGSPVRVTLVKPSAINTPLYDNAKTLEGVKPQGVPPHYGPELAAREILQAAEGSMRDVYVGDTAWLVNWLERLSPRLMDAQFLRVGYRSRSDQPKAETDPNNLYGPVGGRARLRSSFIGFELPVSPYQVVENHSLLASMAIAVAAGGLASLGSGRSRRVLMGVAGAAALMAGRAAVARARG